MKTKILLINTVIFISLLFLSACSGEDNLQETPTLMTVDISNMDWNSVQSGGININNKGNDITDRGLCWSLKANPSINDFKLNSGSGSEDFNLEITGLIENTTYYLRAFATSNAGTGYGNELVFTTNINVDAPCSPTNNTIIFDSEVRNLGNASYRAIGLFYGDYGVESNGTQGDLSIEFSTPPETGIYPIASDSFSMTSKECAVTGVFKVFGDFLSHRYTAKSGANAVVYVLKTGENKYTMTFCDLSFNSGSTTFTFNNSDGNLTTIP